MSENKRAVAVGSLPATNKFTISLERYREMAEDQAGLCISCGEEVAPIEPDARKVRCEVCEQPAVYGAEELLLMGRVV